MVSGEFIDRSPRYLGCLTFVLLVCLGVTALVRAGVYEPDYLANCLQHYTRQDCLDGRGCGCGWCSLSIVPSGGLCLPSDHETLCTTLNGSWDHEVTPTCRSRYSTADTVFKGFGYSLIPVTVLLFGSLLAGLVRRCRSHDDDALLTNPFI